MNSIQKIFLPLCVTIACNLHADLSVWATVKNQVENTVVQIEVYCAEADILLPFVLPQKTRGCGSGFFINNEGYIVTNAHVVKEAIAIWVLVPCLSDIVLEAEVVGIAPVADLALLRLMPEAVEVIKQELGEIPYLDLGDSDQIRRFDPVLALGYPLGQRSVKGTDGMISGYEYESQDGCRVIQISAPTNPGSSGGPLINTDGQVVGINSSGYQRAQNVGYAIPVNRLKVLLKELHTNILIKMPDLGFAAHRGSAELADYMSNPRAGGWYICDVLPGGLFDKAGVKPGDLFYEIDGHQIDYAGKIALPEIEDRLSVLDYLARFILGDRVPLTIYRQGERIDISLLLDASKRDTIKQLYPVLEPIDYELFAGLVVMQLSANHIQLLGQENPRLARFVQLSIQKPALLVTHVIPNSYVSRVRTVAIGDTINKVNDISVETLAEFRQALRESVGGTFLTFCSSDNAIMGSDNVMTALPWDKVAEEKEQFERIGYPVTELAQELVESHYALAKCKEAYI